MYMLKISSKSIQAKINMKICRFDDWILLGNRYFYRIYSRWYMALLCRLLLLNEIVSSSDIYLWKYVQFSIYFDLLQIFYNLFSFLIINKL